MILQGTDSRAGPSFSIRNRVARAAWGVVWALLFRPSLRPMHAWRVFLLRIFGARIGEQVHIHASCKIWAPWQLEIADRVGVGERVIFYNMGPLRIGKEAVISQGAHLCGGTHDYNHPLFQLTAAEIHVEAQAWVCTEAFVGLGVTVPRGAVVGARAVLTKTPVDGAWGVYAGNPARKIKMRSVRG